VIRAGFDHAVELYSIGFQVPDFQVNTQSPIKSEIGC